MKSSLNSNRGFTLIEVLIVIFIISILSVSILLSFRSGQEQAFLTRAAAAFESELRKTQNLSIVSADFEGATPCGYGIYYIDSRVFRIYVGKQGTAPSCRASDHNYQSSIDSVFQELRIIEPEVVFKSGFPNIFFEPPDPTTYINNSSVIGVSTTIQFCLEKDLNKCRNLTVDTAGRISIQ